MKFSKKIKSKLSLILSGAAIGIVNGFFGGGGGMICVPMLEKVLKLDNKKSHATALAVMLPIGISSALVYIFRVSMDWYKFGFVGSGFVIGGILGALLLRRLSGKIVRIVFILVVFAAGIRMLI
ncbi:MAG: sulfite exporter TauE/SafE family protein [Clostridia bacterium]|nr:sulfite exporter TauE/SafE family protein [Clostridia bacterium]